MTKTAERLATRAAQLPEGSLRRQVLEGARGFKAAWVELGRLLSEVKWRGVWREWGHASFEQYCSREPFIRAQTAEKHTASYGFLERHEPALARERPEGDRRAPAFEVVEGSKNVGGLVGELKNQATVGGFWDIETSGQSTSAGGIGKATAEMKDIATNSGAGWNIIAVGLNQTDSVYIWNIVDGVTYPFLSWQP